MIKVGIIGSTGYAGEELVRLLLEHPKIEISFLCSNSHSNESYSHIYPNYKNIIDKKCVSTDEALNEIKNVDVIFTALPSGKAIRFAKESISCNKKLIDIGSDFRLRNAELYKEWYNLEHNSADLLEKAVYGLPELNRDKIKEASLIANPGCFPTASTLALLPLLKNNLIDVSSIIIDAKSGVTGAGRKASVNNLYAECGDSIKAYGTPHHRHTPEIEQTLSGVAKKNIFLTFTPHLVPMKRGILSVCYSNLKEYTDESLLLNLYKDFYRNEHFVRIIDDLPETGFVKGSNFCDISLRVDKRTGKVIVFSAIDNLVKGAAGQAIQNMNIMFRIDETTAINMAPIFP
ncbi:MAG: N-acetyl-gamma-glutamyl-phosphate reductase [Clostridium sp.]|nr:N-acetyl-gamma-glutamyl-phosphate reductase [Clostridium sp.]